MMVATLLEPDLAGIKAAVRELDPAADAFEIRFDALKKPVEADEIRRLTAKPLIATCRRPQDGGAWERGEEERLAILDAASLAGFQLVDLEGPHPHLLEPELILRSLHNFQETPSLEELVRKAHEMGKKGSHVKIATRPKGFHDVLVLLEVARTLVEDGYPASVMGLDDFPRLLTYLIGCEFVYGGGRANALGQPPLRSLRQQWEQWGRPRASGHLYLVVGDPIDHSLSPLLFNTAFRALGQSGAAGALRVRTPDELVELVARGRNIGLEGFNVTSPLKEAAFRACKTVTEEARDAQSVNCVKLTAGGAMGHNTDGLGALSVLQRLVPKSPKKSPVILLGTGGAARGILGGCKEAFPFVVAGRNPKALDAVRAQFGVEVVPADSARKRIDESRCVINATTVPDPIRLDGFQGALFDLHYGPTATPWEKYARAHSLRFAGGRDLLLAQALPGFEFLTGWKAPAAEMKKALGASV